MSKISRFVFGAYSLSVPEETAKNALNILITNNIPFGKTSASDGRLSFCLTVNGYKKYLSVCGGRLFFGERAEALGFFALLGRYRLRVGMFAGILIFMTSLALSTLFVWDVNISGNRYITSEEIYERLDAYGFRIGSFIPSVDTDGICRRIVLESGNIAFMKINMRGTVASVEIQERKKDTEPEDTDTPSNIVAGYDSQIERIEVIGGDVKVSYLQTVRKGELLVSGIIDSPALGYRLVRSRGKVFARVTLPFESVIPLESSQKTYTGKEICEKSVKFFAKTFNLSKNTNIPYEKYDTIVNKEKLYLFGKIELPIYVVTVTHREYEDVPITLSENEALARALADISAQSSQTLAEAEILSRKTDVSNIGGALRVYTEIYCVLDIAEEVKIETN